MGTWCENQEIKHSCRNQRNLVVGRAERAGLAEIVEQVEAEQ